MGYKPSPYITKQEMYGQVPFLLGNKEDKANEFRWSKVVVNLPGDANYDPG